MSGASRPWVLWTGWQFLKGFNYRRLTLPDVDLRNKWVIVTGGNSGIGREAALQFARWGANLVLACREPPPREPHPDVVVEECQSAARDSGNHESTIEWWMCDMSKLSSVQAFGDRWLATGHPLDILANNAGVGDFLGVLNHTEDGFEVLHQINFLSHVFLTLLLLPSLKKAPQPRIVCTTSSGHYMGDFNLANANSGKNSYADNKLYYQTWITELQSRLIQQTDSKHITIQGVHPGCVLTNIWKSERIVKMRMGDKLKWIGIDAQQGSIAITYAATNPEWAPDLNALNLEKKDVRARGNYVNRIWREEPMPQTMDPKCRLELWEFVEKELKLQERGLLKELGV